MEVAPIGGRSLAGFVRMEGELMRHQRPFVLLTVGLGFLASACGADRVLDANGKIPAGGASTGSGPGSGGDLPVGTVAIDRDGGPSSPGGCHCTRRPGRSTATLQCPAGANESASLVIGPKGGTLSLVGQQGIASGVAVELQVPPGVVETPTEIAVTELASPPPAGIVDYSPVYRFDPPGLVLARPVKLRMPWSNRDGIVASDLAIYWSTDGGQTYGRLAEDHLDAGFNDGAITGFGLGFVGSATLDDPALCQ
jgi:hypothetical protein